MPAFSPARLPRIRARLAEHVERKALPGAVFLLARGGEVHCDALGTTAFDGAMPMRRDTIFRITSMTKPVTAVATLSLVEDGKLRLDDPIERHLPELANRRVLAKADGALDDTVPAARSITVRDLLTFRLGFGNPFLPPNATPIQRAANEAKVYTLGPPKPVIPHAPDAWLAAFAKLPLMAQPGDRWMYNTGSIVLGVLLARVEGKPLEEVFRARVFEPLGMKDTAFHVPAEKRARFVPSYWADGSIHDEVDGDWSRPPIFPDAAAGLVSTVDDYFAFASALSNGGAPILSRASVEAMTTDQLPDAVKARSPFVGDYWDANGWGFGVSIHTRRTDLFATPGRYGWDGGYGTAWANDPKEGLVGILMTQRAGFPRGSAPYLDFWNAAYQALE